ncbi:hypothetical protein CF327_g1368 [Tilletia walkeri]|uniref:Chromatin modification-related protein EAF6 n=1 Tax=Tilletia walkeri TaxID=117179 RepID=A0A8X7T5Q7_9BASI|nr:hypothetical protein CF327_g1368 [Tilletia walkeri]KAE8269967.1 hypothetical protein A4X09_0g2392 [Tilletia walkeri]
MSTSNAGASGSGTSSSTAQASSSSTTTTAPPPVTTKEEATARYLSLKSTLKTGLAKKRLIDQTLTDIESQLWLFEGSYLAATAAAGGNIVKGFDNYLKVSAGSGGTGTGTSTSRTGGGTSGGASLAGGTASGASGSIADVPNEDRMFSLSSATYMRSLELKNSEGGIPGFDKVGSAGLGSASSLAGNRQESPADTSMDTTAPTKEEKAGGSARPRKGR